MRRSPAALRERDLDVVSGGFFWQGRRQSDNVEDLRTPDRSSSFFYFLEDDDGGGWTGRNDEHVERQAPAELDPDRFDSELARQVGIDGMDRPVTRRER